MRSWRISASMMVLAIAGASLLKGNAGAQTERVIHNFSGVTAGTTTDGSQPYSGLTPDASGNLYGTTSAGGRYQTGTVFELVRSPLGGWREEVLHSFDYQSARDGNYPYGSLTLDASGNVYGMSAKGGEWGEGSAFELAVSKRGAWSLTLLNSFLWDEGAYPQGGLTFGPDGNIYGTTTGNGKGASVAFQLTPNGHGGWAEKLLHTFTVANEINPIGDGNTPFGKVIFDAAGNLYGTTSTGGAYARGTIFELTPQTDGSWTETILRSFNGLDGGGPVTGLIADASGNFYGTTSSGGSHDDGTVFKFSPTAGGGWSEKILHHFNGADGRGPSTSLVFDGSGNLYGATSNGGANDVGTVFELTPNGHGGWAEKTLHQFGGGTDGSRPNGGLVLDSSGVLYGTTSSGGAYGNGTVYEIRR